MAVDSGEAALIDAGEENSLFTDFFCCVFFLYKQNQIGVIFLNRTTSSHKVAFYLIACMSMYTQAKLFKTFAFFSL